MNTGYKIISLVPDQAHAGYTINGKWLTHTASRTMRHGNGHKNGSGSHKPILVCCKAGQGIYENVRPYQINFMLVSQTFHPDPIIMTNVDYKNFALYYETLSLSPFSSLSPPLLLPHSPKQQASFSVPTRCYLTIYTHHVPLSPYNLMLPLSYTHLQATFSKPIRKAT